MGQGQSTHAPSTRSNTKLLTVPLLQLSNPVASLTPVKRFDRDPFAAAAEEELHASPHVVRTLIGRVSNGKSRCELYSSMYYPDGRRPSLTISWLVSRGLISTPPLRLINGLPTTVNFKPLMAISVRPPCLELVCRSWSSNSTGSGLHGATPLASVYNFEMPSAARV